jgi:transitional endoplasmic reticulum ATPase
VAIPQLQSRRMPLGEVDLAAVARVTEGFSGGDLKAVCQQAAINALMRASGGRADGEAEVRLEDFAARWPRSKPPRRPPHPIHPADGKD